MGNTDTITDVMFRVSLNDPTDVYALFPGEAGTLDWRTCMSYQHVGQHSSADYAKCIRASRPATPEEYASLRRELESAPYHYALDVVQRGRQRHIAARQRQVAR